jgi:hypothetical protein
MRSVTLAERHTAEPNHPLPHGRGSVSGGSVPHPRRVDSA